MSKIALVHYQPIELYPPTLNFIRFLETKSCEFKVCTSKKTKHNLSSLLNNQVIRLLGYYHYNIRTFLKLILYSPEIIVYYESYSAMPVYWYMKVFGRNRTLWMHSHEYFPPDWYETGMKTVRLYHKREVEYLYNRANGLSQTNEFRIEYFLKDYPFLIPGKLHALPNFPPKNWCDFQRNINEISHPIKTIYIGSISVRATYIKEYCEWVIQLNGQVLFDVITNGVDKETQVYINSISSPYIKFNITGIEYKTIPQKIASNEYHVGVILYKGLYLNTAWCASNKLFEYLACGLDVWFTKDMPGTYPYITEKTYPKVLKVDFNNLQNFDLESAISHENLDYKPSTYNCEEVYDEFYKKLSTL
jgi:hypothetical protein